MNEVVFNVGEMHPQAQEIDCQDLYKLRLSTKKLESGKCQVKFYASVDEQHDFYGYVLVDAERTVRDVVGRIQEKLNTIRFNRDFRHIHLYSVGKRVQDDMNFIIFNV